MSSPRRVPSGSSPAGPARSGHLPAPGPARRRVLDPLNLLDPLLEVYVDLVERLAAQGAEWVQLDERVLATDLADETASRPRLRLRRARPAGRLRSCVATYFSAWPASCALATALPVAGLHVDLVTDPDALPALLGHSADTILSAGVVDGRGVWRNDLRRTLAYLAPAQQRLGDRRRGGDLLLAPHVPARPRRRVRPPHRAWSTGWPSPARSSRRPACSPAASAPATRRVAGGPGGQRAALESRHRSRPA